MVVSGLLIGSGMGLSMLPLLLAVQHGVHSLHLGLATSLNQFSRSIGAAVGIAALLAGKVRPNGPTLALLSGRNIDMQLHRAILNGANTLEEAA